MGSNSAPGSPEEGTVFDPGETEPNSTPGSVDEGPLVQPGVPATSHGCYPLKQTHPVEFKLLRQRSMEETTSSEMMLGKQISDTEVNSVVYEAERSVHSSKGSRNTSSSKSRKKPKKKAIITENDFMLSRLKKLITQQHKITFPKIRKISDSDRKRSGSSVQIELTD
ncbi:uncharacterized protein LOC131939451 [Physella acuta]|uniref:uncharacterized protein LOC131939451 n=1 Tax=Physella acuta TaxID=109671 RepID=UPI0027DB5B7C|nr:uncharacterized protein LOC131939451 [Physella acuta]